MNDAGFSPPERPTSSVFQKKKYDFRILKDNQGWFFLRSADIPVLYAATEFQPAAGTDGGPARQKLRESGKKELTLNAATAIQPLASM